jgi:hypothetical protein
MVRERSDVFGCARKNRNKVDLGRREVQFASRDGRSTTLQVDDGVAQSDAWLKLGLGPCVVAAAERDLDEQAGIRVREIEAESLADAMESMLDTVAVHAQHPARAEHRTATSQVRLERRQQLLMLPVRVSVHGLEQHRAYELKLGGVVHPSQQALHKGLRRVSAERRRRRTSLVIHAWAIVGRASLGSYQDSRHSA